MGMAGIPWWTSDIGGFIGGDITDPAFKELLVRWFAWGAFCPVFRMHGERSPWYEREEEFIDGVRQLTSGQDNEVWSFGTEDAYLCGKDLLVAPVMEAGISERAVYLPAGTRWKESATGRIYEGGETVSASAPIDIIPVFIREGADISVYEN